MVGLGNRFTRLPNARTAFTSGIGHES